MWLFWLEGVRNNYNDGDTQKLYLPQLWSTYIRDWQRFHGRANSKFLAKASNHYAFYKPIIKKPPTPNLKYQYIVYCILCLLTMTSTSFSTVAHYPKFILGWSHKSYEVVIIKNYGARKLKPRHWKSNLSRIIGGWNLSTGLIRYLEAILFLEKKIRKNYISSMVPIWLN